MAVKMSTLISWVVTPCGFVGRYYNFGETFSHLQGFDPRCPHSVNNPEDQHLYMYMCFLYNTNHS
jgi:hypothetical protein